MDSPWRAVYAHEKVSDCNIFDLLGGAIEHANLLAWRVAACRRHQHRSAHPEFHGIAKSVDCLLLVGAEGYHGIALYHRSNISSESAHVTRIP